MDFRELMNTNAYDFLREDPHLGDRIMLLGISGSYGYGTNREGSDIDFRGVAFTDSSLCRYYEQAILPVEDEIREILQSSDQALKECQVCGKKFAAEGNQRYCCGACAQTARRKATAKRVRKHRENRYDK